MKFTNQMQTLTHKQKIIQFITHYTILNVTLTPTSKSLTYLRYYIFVDSLISNRFRLRLFLLFWLIIFPLHFRLIRICKLVINTIVEINVIKLFILSICLSHFVAILHLVRWYQQLFKIKRNQHLIHILLPMGCAKWTVY